MLKTLPRPLSGTLPPCPCEWGISCRCPALPGSSSYSCQSISLQWALTRTSWLKTKTKALRLCLQTEEVLRIMTKECVSAKHSHDPNVCAAFPNHWTEGLHFIICCLWRAKGMGMKHKRMLCKESSPLSSTEVVYVMQKTKKSKPHCHSLPFQTSLKRFKWGTAKMFLNYSVLHLTKSVAHFQRNFIGFSEMMSISARVEY